MASNNSKPMVTEIFVDGAKKGWNIGISSTLPNILMAFVIIEILERTGLLKLLGEACGPLMALVGVPGEAAAVLFSALMSMGGAVGVTMSLYTKGTLTPDHIAILLPAIYLMGSLIQYMGRVLGVNNVRGSRIPLMMGIAILNAFIAMFIMSIIV